MKSDFEPKAILVSALVNLGDVIMITACLDMIKRRFPNCRLGVLARPESAEVLSGNPLVDDLLIYAYQSGSLFSGLGNIRDRVKAGAYDCYLSLDRRARGAALAFLAGIPHRFGPKLLFPDRPPKLWTRLLYTKTIPMSPEECRGPYPRMFQLATRRAFALPDDYPARITLPEPGEESRARAENWLSGAEGARIIGLCLKTNHPPKTWPAENSAALMSRLRAAGHFLYVIGGRGDLDYVSRVIDAAGLEDDEKVLNLAGRTSLMDLAALARASDLYIGPDNGAAHLVAGAGQKNLICLMSGTPPESVLGSIPAEGIITWKPGDDGPSSVDAVAHFAANLL